MSEHTDKPFEPVGQAPTATSAPTGVGNGHAGGGPVLRQRTPKTTAQIAPAKVSPDPQGDSAAQLSPAAPIDVDGGEEGEAGEDAAAPPIASPPAAGPPPPADDPFGLHLLPGAGGDGMALPAGLRGDLESATGASLSGVTLHAGAGGAQKADAHGARAVAEGSDIAFAAGEYRPEDPEGKKLIAHEVAHVVQQDVGPTEVAAKRGTEFGHDRRAAEADANDFAVQFAEDGASTRWRPRATAAGPLFAPRDEQTIERDRRHFTEATRGNAPVTAAAYLQSFYKSLLHGVGQFLLARPLAPGHPDLRWIEGWRDFVAKLGQLLDVGDGRDVIVRLAACLAGNGRGSLYEITDRVRPISDDGHRSTSWAAELTGQPEPDDGNVYNDGPRGPRIWQPSVGIAVGEAMEQVLAELAMPPIAAQFIAHAERNRQLANDRGELPADVKASELIPGHPLSWYVARAFAEPPASVEPAGGKLDADPDAVVAYKKVKEVRWLGPPAPWNAVQPVKPAKTSPEAMAARFLGAPTQAHRIKQVGDYYLLPEEVAATIPEAARNRPKRRNDAPPTDDVHALATSTLGDQAAAAEADVKGAKVPEAGELIGLWTAIDKKLLGLVLATAKLPGQALVAGAAARHTAARLGLEALGPEESTARAVVYRAQLDLLTQIAEDVGALATHIDQNAAADPWADKVSAGQKARLTALLRAASLSHVPDTGKAALDEARTLEQTQVLDTLEALFADAVARVEAARHVKDEARTQSKRGAEVFGATLPERRDRIRVEMADLRTKLRNGTAEPEAIQRLVTKVDGFRFEAMLVANYGAIQQVMVATEQLESSDWVAAVGKIDNLEDVRGAGNRLRMGLARIYSRWLQANREAQKQLARVEAGGGANTDLEATAHALIDVTLGELRARFESLGDDEGVQQFLRHAYDEIDDAQTKAAILQVATMIGVTIAAAVVSAGVGSLAGGAAAGLVGEGLVSGGVAMLAESATMSAATTLLNGGGFGEAYVSDMAQNLAMLGALKGFDTVFRATRLGAVVGRGPAAGRLGYYTAKGVELTGRSLVMAGVMLAGAEVESLRKQGRTLSTAEIEEQGIQGIAQVIGTAVLARLARTPMAQLEALGARGGALVKQHAALKILAYKVKKSKTNPAQALELLQAERAYLEAQLGLWQDLSTRTPAELHRMGVEREVVEAMVGSTSKHLGGLDQLEGGTLPAQLGLEAVVPGKVYEGAQAQVAKVLESYRKPGVTIETHAQGDGSYRYRVVGPDKVPLEIIAHTDAAARPRGAAPGSNSRSSAQSTAPNPGAGQPAPARPQEQVRADVERASLRAANMAGGVKVEGGGSMRLLDGAEGFAVRVEVADLGADASRLTVADDHAVLTVSTRTRPEQVERVIAHRLTEAAALTARRRAGKPLDVPDALGKGATGGTLSPADMGKIAELRVMRRQFEEATAEGPGGAERARRLGDAIRAFEESLDILSDSADGKQRRRMVETQVVVQNDRARRERARVELDGDRGHPGIELHSHFMGVVDTETFRRKAAMAATGEDTGSWVPVLEQLATLKTFQHGYAPDGAITKRSAAGDAFAIAKRAREQIADLSTQARDASPEARHAIQERIEMIAEEAARTALTATERTDFNSAYEMRDELVKSTFAGETPRPTGDPAKDRAAAADYEARAYDEYTREAIRRLARDRVGYTEQSNSAKKLGTRFGADRVRRIIDELIAAGEIKPGEVDVRFLTMIPTHHFGERVDGNPEETHAPRELEPAPQKDGTIRPGFEQKLDVMTEQVARRQDTLGFDIASLERYHFDEDGREAFKLMYHRLAEAARKRGQPAVLRPHVGEGSVDNTAGVPFDRDDARKRTATGELTHQARAKHNLDQLLTALEELRDAGVLDPTVVVVRFGHATVATPEQVGRMHAIGVIAEVNLGSNVRTGSADQTVGGADGKPSSVEKFDDHALPTMLYYDAQVILSTDAHDVMSTTMRDEYQRAHRLVEEVLSGERKVRVRAAEARGRGQAAEGADGDRWLSVEELTPAELDRFTRGYEKLHADAEAYYAHRPRPEAGASSNQPGDASPAGGAHWTDTARKHKLLATEGQRRFAGARADVEVAVADYRRQGATALPIHDGAGAVVYRVTSADGRAILELEGWSDGRVPVADLDDPLAPGSSSRSASGRGAR